MIKYGIRFFKLRKLIYFFGANFLGNFPSEIMSNVFPRNFITGVLQVKVMFNPVNVKFENGKAQ